MICSESLVHIFILLSFILGLLIGNFGFNNVGDNEKITTTLFAGAVAEKAWEEIIEKFEEETGIKVIAYYSGSGKVLSALKIVKNGDLFAPGSPDYMAKAIEDGVVNPKYY